MIFATEFVCTMTGSSVSALLKCSDGHFYVVKCQEFALSNRALSNAFLARKLARYVGLPVPEVEVIQVDQWLLDRSLETSRTAAKPWLVNQSPEVTWPASGARRRKKRGLQLGSRYLVEPGQGTIFAYFPENMLYKVRNLEAFAGILTFDVWMNKTDVRRALFWRQQAEPHYSVAFVDLQADLLPTEFRSVDRATDPTRVGLYTHKAAYRHISSWDDFEPFLSRIERISLETMVDIAAQIPQCWCKGENEITEMLEILAERGSMVRNLLKRCLIHNKEIFPNWGNEAAAHGRKSTCRSSDPNLDRLVQVSI